MEGLLFGENRNWLLNNTGNQGQKVTVVSAVRAPLPPLWVDFFPASEAEMLTSGGSDIRGILQHFPAPLFYIMKSSLPIIMMAS